MQRKFDVDRLLDQLSSELSAYLTRRGVEDPVMIGIHTGGVWVAERLHQRLELSQPLGVLDISFYRDDFTRIGVNPQVRPSSLPVPVDGQSIVLVDDVLYTGRTIRAGLNEIFDYGRPASVILAVLVERSGRELPIQPDVAATHVDLRAGQHIKLKGPKPLTLEISAANK